MSRYSELMDALKYHPTIRKQVDKYTPNERIRRWKMEVYGGSAPLSSLGCAFAWGNTPQGGLYWGRINLPPPENVWIDVFGVAHDKEKTDD